MSETTSGAGLAADSHPHVASFMRATDMRHRPAFCPAPGLAGLLLSSLPERACGTTGRFTAPAAPCANTWPPCAEGTRQKQKPRTQIVACVPHADGLCGLLHVPGASLALTLTRSCELSPGHALGPSARCYRRLPPSALTVFSDLRRPERGIVAATRIPLHTTKTLATRPPIGTRRGEDIGPRREVYGENGGRKRKL